MVWAGVTADGKTPLVFVQPAPHANLDDLKATLIKEWAKIPVETLRAAVDDMPKRLRACMKEKGGNFEI
ncbi:unnamed protein product, partial [Mesorhabditis belari]|uniref:Uncharacterized protein n=1 Tax=Mesorhabditis belari TaxID=2138241 RepID=A0AAF3FRE0_9BILA